MKELILIVNQKILKKGNSKANSINSKYVDQNKPFKPFSCPWEYCGSGQIAQGIWQHNHTFGINNKHIFQIKKSKYRLHVSQSEARDAYHKNKRKFT